MRIRVVGAPPGKSHVRYTLWVYLRALGGSGNLQEAGSSWREFGQSAFHMGCRLWIVSGSPEAIEVGRIYHAFPLKNENRYFTMFFMQWSYFKEYSII